LPWAEELFAVFFWRTKMNNSQVISITVPVHHVAKLQYALNCAGEKSNLGMKLLTSNPELISKALEPVKLLRNRLNRLAISCLESANCTIYRIYKADYEDYVKGYFIQAQKDLVFRLNECISDAHRAAYIKAAHFQKVIRKINSVAILVKDRNEKLTEMKNMLGEITVSAEKPSTKAA